MPRALMPRALVTLSALALFLTLVPIVALPSGVVQGASIMAVCDGVNDATDTINPAINSANHGDTIVISHPVGLYCDIDFPIRVTRAVTLQSSTPVGSHATFL